MDSREIKVCGLIMDLKVKLVAYLDNLVLMDVVVIDVLDVLAHKVAPLDLKSKGLVLAYGQLKREANVTSPTLFSL